jgi:hypothetical protein
MMTQNVLDKTVDDLAYSNEYADYLMKHSERPICNGDMLLEQMEEGYMFDEFLTSIGIKNS